MTSWIFISFEMMSISFSKMRNCRSTVVFQLPWPRTVTYTRAHTRTHTHARPTRCTRSGCIECEGEGRFIHQTSERECGAGKGARLFSKLPDHHHPPHDACVPRCERKPRWSVINGASANRTHRPRFINYLLPPHTRLHTIAHTGSCRHRSPITT